jgi:uncharacterized protein (DUF2267 family)
MSATGLDVFDKTIHTTNIWLDDIMAEIGPDRHIAWHTLGAVLHAVRDRMPVELAAHLGAELPLVVRGLYYDQFRPETQPVVVRDRDAFLLLVQRGLAGIRPVNPEAATKAVLGTLSRHITRGQVDKAREALPKDVRELWPAEAHAAH